MYGTQPEQKYIAVLSSITPAISSVCFAYLPWALSVPAPGYTPSCGVPLYSLRSICYAPPGQPGNLPGFSLS